MHSPDDTIVAIASPPGGAARGIVRLSGPRVRECVASCFQADNGGKLAAVVRAEAIGGSLRLAGIAAPLPCQVYLWPDGRSYTGQPVAEIHTLGSPPLLEAAVDSLCAAGARVAEPGEFTLRAFLAGRIDLTQAEAVLGVIDAADAGQLDVALAQLAGGLAGPLGRLRDRLLDLLADLEAGLDFAEEDLEPIAAEQLCGQLDETARQVAGLSRQMASRSQSGPAVRAVLLGQPNVGKSSLFNALGRQAGALVCERPGTTRDYLTAELDLDGVKCQLIDTAGMGLDAAGPVDEVRQAAQAVSAEQGRRAHVRLLCLESTRPPTDWERSELERIPGGAGIVVLTKIDLAGPVGVAADVCHGELRDAVPTSSVTGAGIDRLRRQLRQAVILAQASATEVVAGTAIRCRESLHLAAGSLDRARRIARRGTGEELVAAEVRVALDELGKVVGAVYTDDVLDRVFSRFCIGK